MSCAPGRSRALFLPIAAGLIACEAPAGSTESHGGCAPLPGAVIDVARGLADMSDLEALARAPVVPYTERLASSYDRASVSPDQSGWFANQDMTGFVRDEGNGERVMLEASGPGMITRIWSARPQGLIRMYFDGASTPAVEAQFAALLAGSVAPFESPFAFQTARGANLVYPIPFRDGIKVTTDATTLFYQLDYLQFSTEADVRTLDVSTARDARTVCYSKRAAAALSGLPDALGEPVVTDVATLDTAATDDTVFVARAGGDEITRLRIIPERADEAALRRVAIEMTFDGERTVFTPLGDLFAYGAGSSAVKSLPARADADALELRFPMPFAREAHIRITDVGGGPLRARLSLTRVQRDFDEMTYLFHAHWTGVSTFDAFAPQEWTLADITGTGRYVGTALHVANPHTGWWGEGDEKVWVDGEANPSRFGTGTEDYFGYAYCDTDLFSAAFTGQTRANRTNFAGYTSLYRFHVADAIPFQRSFRFDLEILHWASGVVSVPVQYDAVYYFYARPGATAGGAALTPAEFVTPELPIGVVESGEQPAAHCGD